MDVKHTLIYATIDDNQQLKNIKNYFLSQNITLKLDDSADKVDRFVEIIKKIPEIASKLDVDEIEKFLNSIITLMDSLDSERTNFFAPLIASLQDKAFDGVNVKSKAAISARILSHILLTSTNMPEVQKEAFFGTLNMHSRSQTMDKLIVDKKMLKSFFTAWDTSLSDKREMLRTFYKALITNGRVSEGTLICLELLATYSDKEIDETIEDAKECARANIKDNSVYFFDCLLNSPAFENFKKVAPLWYELITIFTKGNYLDYQKFAKANSSFLKELEIPEDILENRMRNLTLVSLAEKKSYTPLKEVLDSLGFKNQEEFEIFQVRGWKYNNVTSRINEITSEVFIEKNNHRQFSQGQYIVLSKYIDSAIQFCKNTIENLEGISEESKEILIDN
ncbi:Eukaryotic translation initiation factor 3 subunit M [Strongyloides ratti]|uniref:Eukaryotic translation initiation factor 3 subunit M n=1 Tax=Strongyloides ratti TaxID=34506 RepID=A0A090LIJ9_STRRB|nr:Eukaryotic translation initiation factor 3 subunit M [Strongyloides ratti]CEF67968.1 Eukaryotic translation initiation factor 3 subunit M [Strongyloides ratti]